MFAKTNRHTYEGAAVEVVGFSGFLVFGGAVGAVAARRVAGRDAQAAADG